MTNPTVVDTRQAVASGQISHFAPWDRHLLIRRPRLHLRLAALRLFPERDCREHPENVTEAKPKTNHRIISPTDLS